MKRNDGSGSVRKIKEGYECLIQSSKCYNANGNPVRIKRRGKTFEEAVENAKKAILRLESQIDDEAELKELNGKTFGEYVEYYLKYIASKKIAASTYATYTYTLRANFYEYPLSKYPLKKLTGSLFKNHYNKLKEDKEDISVWNTVNILSQCCNWLVKYALIPVNYSKLGAPERNLKKDEYVRDDETEIKKVFTSEDIKKFYYAYVNNMTEIAPAVILMLETMMRGQEMLALTLDDIDMEKDIIHIRSAVGHRFKDKEKLRGKEKYIKVPKNGEARITVMSPLAKEAVEKMIEQINIHCPNNPGNFLFPVYKGGKGGMRSMDSLEQSFIRLCEKLQIDRGTYETKAGKKRGLNIHALRHSADTIANTAKGANVVNTALMAGHKAISMENTYTHATLEALRSVSTASTEILKLDKNLKPKEKLKSYPVVKSKDIERIEKKREQMREESGRKDPTPDELYRRLLSKKR